MKKERIISTIICGIFGMVGAYGIGNVYAYIFPITLMVAELLIIESDSFLPLHRFFSFFFFVIGAILGGYLFEISRMGENNPKAYWFIGWLTPALWLIFDLFNSSNDVIRSCLMDDRKKCCYQINPNEIVTEEVIKELCKEKVLNTDRVFINNLQLDCLEPDHFLKWGEKHFFISKNVIYSRSKKYGKYQDDYLDALKVHYEELCNSQAYKDLLSYILVVITVLTSIAVATNLNKNMDQLVVFSIIIFLNLLYWISLRFKSRDNYRNRFYLRVINAVSVMKEKDHINEKSR